jgi:hypothetical protein
VPDPAASALAAAPRRLCTANIPFFALTSRLEVVDGSSRYCLRSRGLGSDAIGFFEPGKPSPTLQATVSSGGGLDRFYELRSRGVLVAQGSGGPEHVTYRYHFTDVDGTRLRIDTQYGLRPRFILRQSNGVPWIVARQCDILVGKRWAFEAPNGIDAADADALLPALLLVVYLERVR